MSKKTSTYVSQIEGIVRNLEGIRRDTERPVDISLAEFIKGKGDTMEYFYEDIGIDPNFDSIQNLVNLPDTGYRWLIPEIFRDALRLGLRKAPIYQGLIAGEQTIKGTSVVMPAINMSEAVPHVVGVAQTIPVGDVSFDQKSVKIYKVGRGIKVPYEVINYVSLNIVSLFLQDYGVKLGNGIDYLALTTLLNGDQADGSDSVATIGIATANTLTYKDLLKAWVRMARLGRNIANGIAGEDMAVNYLDLLTTTRVFGTARTGVDIKTPIPQNSSLYVNSTIAANKLLMVDASSAMIKLNAQPLLVETEKIISNQTQETYASLTTGFGTMFRDARLVIDQSLSFSGNGFPSWMDPSVAEQVVFPK